LDGIAKKPRLLDAMKDSEAMESIGGSLWPLAVVGRSEQEADGCAKSTRGSQHMACKLIEVRAGGNHEYVRRSSALGAAASRRRRR
jgi:hypothetical protein